MTAHPFIELLKALRERGVALRIQDGRLQVRPWSKVREGERALLLVYRDLALALLAPEKAPVASAESAGSPAPLLLSLLTLLPTAELVPDSEPPWESAPILPQPVDELRQCWNCKRGRFWRLGEGRPWICASCYPPVWQAGAVEWRDAAQLEDADAG